MTEAKKLKETKKFVERVLGILKKRNETVDVYFVNDKEMKQMYGKATNVLAYSEPEDVPHPETRKKFLGEIYLNPGYIKKRGEDIEYLAMHGLLHLLGYNHEKRKDRMRMEIMEEWALKNVRTKS
ncbi:rRNA maturation RNase YbeY [Candidatus Wolfebacteria bacterium RIFCSPLOWO2_01_FULL_45_19]|uniref:rRNA maturation RNase YbeY n=1 Tax=Candidatus Wolfebacteria bacterium RIFCSPLOWO2_01_FULL_45_19 TaxID=1802557 RepID=A0A1F8DS53_9BACT|nr:MAG: putative rRNA maturation factor [Parcubacteria group bacterium GW2011_GWB1_45_9]OGM90648.1 MAG: rRNA maturation RNase YbeY [Candidatus Wolfebacteria bacterium RIFCSPLOWO2_01_FULL_45_19]